MMAGSMHIGQFEIQAKDVQLFDLKAVNKSQ